MWSCLHCRTQSLSVLKFSQHFLNPEVKRWPNYWGDLGPWRLAGSMFFLLRYASVLVCVLHLVAAGIGTSASPGLPTVRASESLKPRRICFFALPRPCPRPSPWPLLLLGSREGSGRVLVLVLCGDMGRLSGRTLLCLLPPSATMQD